MSGNLDHEKGLVAADNIRVIKVGGSLLRDADSIRRAKGWLDSMRVTRLTRDVVLAGGGDCADWVREWDETWLVGKATAHRLAIDAMSFQIKKFRRSFPRVPLAGTIADLQKFLCQMPMVFFDSSAWILAQPGTPLSWDFTSDSIAARLGRYLNANELILLKSTLPQAGSTIAEAARLGIVDAFFPESAAGIETVRLINLRASGQEMSWISKSGLGNEEKSRVSVPGSKEIKQRQE